MSGPPPTRDSARRRSNKPASYGEAEPEVVEGASTPPSARVLGFGDDVHELIQSLWDAVQESAEARYYSDADWQRVRLELYYGNKLLLGNRTPGAEAWKTLQMGLNTLLISPADKRRVGIELAPVKVDEDDKAADEALAEVLTLVQRPPTGTDGD
ncbi:terminase small subunit [Mycobacterium phage MalagasyRose]|uniref:Terminase small subunit n=1 Tax=Mycobacterium phage MalagasyRose TaxID=2599870 RepID=A0A5J6TDF3_9CAUD|nr:terminase small subunit [Mycobacterium phage MalagasyRose]QFG08856.1 terminase small subunit [Mycobacterium phage MalagasyRose]